MIFLECCKDKALKKFGKSDVIYAGTGLVFSIEK